MFTRILITAAAIAATTVFTAPAQAGQPDRNGVALNGMLVNGQRVNGHGFNGITRNGITRNGITRNGITRNGKSVSGDTAGDSSGSAILVDVELAR